MKNVNVGKIVMVIGIITLLGIGVNAFAGWGRGWHHGSDWQQRGWRMGRGGYQFRQLSRLVEADGG